MSRKSSKSILFRVPEDIYEDLIVEIEFTGMTGQRFLETLVRKNLENPWSSVYEVNYGRETRDSIRKRLFPSKRQKVKLRKRSEAPSLTE